MPRIHLQENVSFFLIRIHPLENVSFFSTARLHLLEKCYLLFHIQNSSTGECHFFPYQECIYLRMLPFVPYPEFIHWRMSFFPAPRMHLLENVTFVPYPEFIGWRMSAFFSIPRMHLLEKVTFCSISRIHLLENVKFSHTKNPST